MSESGVLITTPHRGFDSGLLHSGLLHLGLLDGFDSGLLHSGHRIFVGAFFCVRSNLTHLLGEYVFETCSKNSNHLIKFE